MEKKIQVVRISDVEKKPINDGIAFGTVNRQAISDGISETVRVGLVNFMNGAGNIPHSHAGDQILIITEGECIVTSEEGAFVASAGDVVIVPAGLVHTHSAKPGTNMSHFGIMAIQPGVTQFSKRPE